MSSLPSLSLGSRFWVKNCSDISTGLGTLPLSLQHPVPDWWAGIFLGTGSLRQQIPFGNEFLQNSCLEKERMAAFHGWGRRGKKQQDTCRAFLSFPWFQKGGCRTSPVLQFHNSNEFFWVRGSSTKANKYHKEYNISPCGWWLWSCALSKLAHPFYIWRMWLNASWQVLQVILYRLLQNPFLVKRESSAFLFSKVSPSVLANSDEGFLEVSIPFHIPKDNTQRFPGLLFAQVAVSAPVRGEREEELCFILIISKAVLHIILSMQTKNSSCAVAENPLLSTPWRAPAYEHKTFRFPFFNASELALPIAGRADEEICVSPSHSLVAWWIVEVLIENSNHSLAVLQITTPDSWFTPFHACCLCLLLEPRLHESIISTQSVMDWPGVPLSSEPGKCFSFRIKEPGCDIGMNERRK